jgi:heme oxygenase
MDETLLREIINKIDKLDEKLTNFMGFFDLAPGEKKELLKDIETYKKGKLDMVSLGEAEKLV